MAICRELCWAESSFEMSPCRPLCEGSSTRANKRLCATEAKVRVCQKSLPERTRIARTRASSRDDANCLGGDSQHVPCALAQTRSISRAAESDPRWSRTRVVVRMRSSRSCPDGRCGVGNHSGARVWTTLHCGQFPAGSASLPFNIPYCSLHQ